MLNAFARDIGAGPDKTVLLVLVNAGWHTSPKLDIPDGIRFCFLPAYTPELQPAEQLWPLADESVANIPFNSLAQLADKLDLPCNELTNAPDLIKANTCFNWWPAE